MSRLRGAVGMRGGQGRGAFEPDDSADDQSPTHAQTVQSHDSPVHAPDLVGNDSPPLGMGRGAATGRFESRRGIGSYPARGRGSFANFPEVTNPETEKPKPATPSRKVVKAEGTTGKEINLLTNYFQVLKDEEWTLYKYTVEFYPDEDNVRIRRGLLRTQQHLGRFIFDSTLFYTAHRVEENKEGNLIFNVTKNDGSVTKVVMKFIKAVEFGDPIYIQFFNIMVRKCMNSLGLEEIGRGHFDSTKAIDFHALKIQLWPGFLTAINQHENDLLLNVEITHKVLRTECVLGAIQSARSNYRGRNFEEHINTTYKDAIVMTNYNHATYRIIEVDFKATPSNTFKNKKGEDLPFDVYYKAKYGRTITTRDQPLLIAKPTRKPPKRFQKDDEDYNVILLPEFCLFTGLSDSMRQNNSLMRELSGYLQMGPFNRIKAINEFMGRLIEKTELIEELRSWGLHFNTNLLTINGRVLPKETILFANGKETPNDQADWTKAFRNLKLLNVNTSLDNWVLMVPQKDVQQVDNLVKTMQKVSNPLGFQIKAPKILILPDSKSQTYVRILDEEVRDKVSKLQLVFVVLATNSSQVYCCVKKRLVVDYGISSQCFLAKNMSSKGLMSIATKLTIQMCTKLGGQPWTVKLPLKSLMVVGIDCYNNVSGMVASINQQVTKFFSTISTSKTPGDLIKNLCSDLEKCLEAYKVANLELPKRIVVYREGKIDRDGAEVKTETDKLLEVILCYYNQEGKDLPAPKLTYIIVSKKINGKFFLSKGPKSLENPPPGTVVDTDIILKNRHQFFLTSAVARQGSVAPCCYIVAYDDGGLDDDKLQILTYKLCHMYFNWSGTVSVPALVQYAHKLAQLTYVAYEGLPAHNNLSHLLFYL